MSRQMMARESDGRLHSHVHPSRGDVDHARLNGFAVSCLAHGDGAESIHPLGEGSSKTRWHVLHDEDRHRKITREKRQNFLKSFRASG